MTPKPTHTLYSKAQSPPPHCWRLTSLTFRASTVYKSLQEKSEGRWRDLRETQEPIEEGYVCMLSKPVLSCTQLQNQGKRHSDAIHFTVCFLVSREHIMPTSQGKSDKMFGSPSQPRWADSLNLLVLDGFHDHLVTHLQANRIYESESSVT